MNILNKVTFKSLLKNKTRTIATLIGVILSTALMCTVTGAVSSFMGTLYNNAVYKAGYWNFYDESRPAHDYYALVEMPSMKEVKYTQILGFSGSLENSGSVDLKILGTSGNFSEENMAVHMTEGEYPASNKEILMPAVYKYSTDLKIGDKITLEIGDRMLDGENINDRWHEDGEYIEVRETREYTVTGFYYVGRSCPLGFDDASPALTLADEGMPDGYLYDYYLIYKNPLQYEIPDRELYYVSIGGCPNNSLYDALGRGESLLAALLFAAAGVILVGVGSVSLIYNAFSISVSERTKLFGLLSSVGASKKQIKGTVIMEALMVSLVGIPLGLAAGVGIVAGGIAFLTHMFGKELGGALGLDVPFTMSINGWALGIAVVISLLTVLISAWIPAKRATKISAIEAIHMTTEISDKQIRTSPITDKLFGLSGTLASKYYKRSRKRYRTTIISLVFSIVLFISTSGFSDIFMTAVIYNSFSFNYDVSADVYYYSFSDGNTPDDLLETFERIDGITNAAYVAEPSYNGYEYGRIRMSTEYVSQRAQNDHWLIDLSYYETHERSEWLYGKCSLLLVDDESFREVLREYGLDEAAFMDPDEPLAIAIDGNKSYDYDAGRYITKKILYSDYNEIYGYYFDNDALQDNYHYDITYDKDGEASLTYYVYTNGMEREELGELEVESYLMKTGKVIYDYPYFVDKNYNDLTIIYPISLAGKVHESFARIKPNNYFFKADDHAACVKEVETILGSSERYIRDYAGEQQDTRNVVTAATVVVYIFVAVIALISVTNVFNTITTNINLRRREFAMLKSIGMTSNGFNGMMNFECVLYGAKSLLYGLPISLVILVILNLLMTQGYDMTFNLPWLAIFITIAGVFAVVFVTMMYALTKVKKANPINELKNENI